MIRKKGNTTESFDRNTINTLIQDHAWLQELGATIAYDPQTVVRYNDEGGVKASECQASRDTTSACRSRTAIQLECYAVQMQQSWQRKHCVRKYGNEKQ